MSPTVSCKVTQTQTQKLIPFQWTYLVHCPVNNTASSLSQLQKSRRRKNFVTEAVGLLEHGFVFHPRLFVSLRYSLVSKVNKQLSSLPWWRIDFCPCLIRRPEINMSVIVCKHTYDMKFGIKVVHRSVLLQRTTLGFIKRFYN